MSALVIKTEEMHGRFEITKRIANAPALRETDGSTRFFRPDTITIKYCIVLDDEQWEPMELIISGSLIKNDGELGVRRRERSWVLLDRGAHPDWAEEFINRYRPPYPVPRTVPRGWEKQS